MKIYAESGHNSVETKGKIVVSVLIPVYDDIAGLETTLKSLADDGTQRIEKEIIVCNDGGGEPVSSMAKRYGCLETRLKERKGSYSARNAGLAMARGQVIAFLDADQRVDIAWIDAGVKALENADYVGGRIVLETGSKPGIWERYDQLNAFPVEFYLQENKFAPTANLFVRRRVFGVVGRFRGDLKSGGDYEFGRRVHAAGFVQRYAADVITFHHTRNQRQQLRKLRRVASGKAEIQLRITGEGPRMVILSSLHELVKSLAQMMRGICKYPFTKPERGFSDTFFFMLIDKFRAGMFHFWILVWAIKWVKKL